MTPAVGLALLWREAGLPEAALGGIEFSGRDPVLPSSFAIGTAAAVSIGAEALASSSMLARRGGPAPKVLVALRDAAIEFRSERYLRVNGAPPPDLWDAIAGLYRTKDGWVRLHTNFPHHREGVLRLLGCAHEREAVARALARWEAERFDREATEAGLTVARLRSFDAWDASEEGAALISQPTVSITRFGDAPAVPLSPATRPLAGLRVLDLTRVIAGPVAGRALASYGAEVLAISASHLPQMAPLVIDTGRGKLSSFLDLREEKARETLRELVRSADVFLQSYRPGALDHHGFGAEEVARLRPGLVHATLSAYGFAGPWAARRGFDSLVQTASGFNDAEAKAAGEATPRPLPAQALDHASGHLLAFGIIAALLRRAAEGGSFRVRVSLARTGLWLRSLGRVANGFACPDPGFSDISDRLEETDSGFGRLTVVRPAAEIPASPPRHGRPAMPLGTHPAHWPAP
ncbi:MAG TPA: CoA transferase [Acetobacteraceae bacterium]|nr:CoA transferase [Acetobacteraceae bacterium]